VSRTPFDLLDSLQSGASAARELLLGSGVARWEVFAKASLTTTSLDLRGRRSELSAEEIGVAVRTWDGRRAGFGAASGMEPAAARRAVDGCLAARCDAPRDPLPPRRLLGTADPPQGAEAPPRGWAAHVAGEVAAAIHRRSEGRLRPCRLAVHHGTWGWLLLTAEGFVAGHQACSSFLEVEVTGEPGIHGTWRSWQWIPSPGEFSAERAAAAAVDRALLAGRPAPVRSGLADLLLHGEVTAHLLAALEPLLLASPGDDDPVDRLVDRSGQLASPVLTLVDDRCGTSGPLPAPCDGEGLPARPITLLDHGVPRHRVACYRDAVGAGLNPNGGALRLSFRDLPASGLANLSVDTSLGVPPSRLLARAGKAYYLLRLVTPVEVDTGRDEIRLLASGLSMDGGRPGGWHPVVEVRGSLSRLLRGVEAVGTDLHWYQTAAGFVGAPSLLVLRQPVTEGG